MNFREWRARGRSGKKRAGCRGAAAVEFAMTAPILMLFVFAGFEYSHMNSIRNAADFACTQGARQGVLPGASSGQCKSMTDHYLALSRVQGATVEISPAVITPQTPEVTVTVSVPLSRNALPLSSFVVGNTLVHSITLKREFVGTADGASVYGTTANWLVW